MVKTRHSGDIEVESPPKFLSLTNEKSRQSLNNSDAVGDSRQSGRGAYGETRDAYSIFEDRVVESRLRPRIGPSRAYNYLDVDSSDEEIIRKRRERHHPIHQNSPERRRSRYSRSRQIKQEMLDEQQEQPRRLSRRRSSLHEEMELSLEDEEGDDDNEDSRDTRSRRRGVVDDESAEKLNRGRSSNRRQHAVEDDPEDEKAARGRSTRRRQRPSREEDEERENLDDSGGRGSSSRQNRQRHTAEDDDDHLIRRSSRTRRQVYDTLNQSYLVSIPGRPKHDFDENNDHSDTKDQDTDDQEEYSDMYSRVKRKRVQVKRNMYGIPVNEDSDSDQEVTKRNKNNSKQDEEEEDDEENCDDEEEDEEGNEKGDNRRTTRRSMPLQKKQPQIVKAYSLREHKPQTNLYKAPVEEPRIKRIHHSIFAVTPTKKNNNQTYRSPAQRRNIRKRSALHSSSSSTSSSDSESNDEKSFKRRKAKSMAKARSRMMPMNFSTDAVLSASVIKDRVRSGASLADVEPMNIDRSVTFNSIGGLGKHIRALKEMVVFPLLYDKVFQRFKVDPPRGVLFYGPPGTGKTLVARALANECSQGDRRVAFFMRKGADCLSKWVGESERQLRLLFDQAYKFRPSIIFFDEIDGLAPVRSSRQDQIHSSIVSTLLALMDGLDSRGEIVVIGATNRIDSLDPALRRPGRFDREFLFPLPSLEARKQILKIHTASWSPKLNDNFISELAEKCVGYCGADLKALCTEAAMLALRRRYPQIYITNEALQLDVSSINVSAKDFFDAVSNIIPTSQRAVNTPARALTARVCPLLQRQLDKVMEQLSDTFPPCLAQTASLDAAVTTSQAEALAESGVMWDELASDEDEDAPSIFVPPTSSKGSKANRRSIDEGPNTSQTTPTYLNFTSYATSRPTTFRPRLMLVGREGQGQTTYIAPAVIHKMENLPVHVLDLPALYAVTAKTPEESCANVFHEAKRKCPSIIYLPYVNQWWDVMAETLRATLLTLIQDLDPTIPLLLLATSEQPYHTLDPVLQSLFSKVAGEVLHMSDPNMEERRMFFKDLLLRQACRPPPQKKQAGEILKLLKETKRQKPSFRMRRVKRKIREKSEVSSIYPFGANDENETEMCAEQVVDFEACKEKGVPSVAPSCKRKRPQRIRGEVLELKEDLTLTSGKQLASVTVKMTPKPVPMRPSVNSTHGMVLRSHGNHGKLNSNQSARESGQGYQPLVYTSSAPAPTLGHSQGDDFKKPSRPSGRDTQCSMSERRLRYLRRIGEINTNRGHSCVNSSPGHLQNERKHVSKAYRKSEFEQSKSHASLTDRHDRYLRRLRKLEARMAEAGPSDQSKSMTCDERNFLSARHLRYLRRLRKLDAMLGRTDCNSKCMLYDPDASSHEPGNLLKYKSNSVLSCGSLQMSYKTSTSSDGSTRKYNSELALPLNLRDLCSHRQSGVSSSCQSAHYKQKLTYALKGNKKAMSFPQRYNLRPKKNRGRTNDAQRMLEVLPKASAPKPRELTKEELELLVEKEELTLMELRIFLRDVLNKLGSDKKFSIFAKPVNIEDAPDYYEIIEHPMDLSTMMGKIDLHEYNTVRAFMDDIDLICSNALEYNPNRGPMDRVIRHRACALKDTAYAIIKTELDKDFEKTCVEIQESRKRRGEKSITVPNFYYTLPKNQPSSRVNNTVIPSYLQNPKPVRSIPKPEGERFSRRVRGLNSDPVPPLEAVEKLYRGARSGASPTRENKNNSNEDSGAGSSQQDCSTPQAESQSDHTYSARKTSTSVSKEDRGGEDSKSSEGNKSQQSLGTSSSKKRKNKCVWCRPRRKRPRLLSTKPQSGRGSGDEGGEDVSNEEEEEEDEEPTQELEKSSTKQLEVDTSEQEDLKSPRISTRNRSPALTSPPSRVATRRSSMSPHQGSSLASHSQGNTDQTEPKQDTVTPGTDQEGLSENRERKTDKKNLDSAQITGTQASLLGQMVSPPSEPVEKPSVVKRLDLDSVAVDSGVGSSVDSNGDSRDSMDHRGEGDSSLRATTVFTTTQDANQNCSTELKNRASAILNEPSQKIVVDNNRLTSLLNRLVARTDGYTVERLEKIYSHLSQIIYRHRHEYNKSGMVVDLERKVEELTKIVPSTSSTLQH